MAGKIVIDAERCKGCGLCVAVCPKHSIKISTESNRSGYFPAQPKDAGCTGCGCCAIICPEGIIVVFREEAGRVQGVAAGAKKKDATDLAGKKR